ncbi:ABC transporter permease [Desmospora profundinema]|uniref:Transport permease protein n=1 Tax=Desmospora profundinema TaxID=1571184 RepID=A0ABU1IQ52_9BACL|nr:ABC transporter permease [Desmospora profundinema]MDR6225880.1 ABC-2 type transport system permease protein [Desmospora profundinema]
MFANILKYRELLYFLVHKEVRIRYRNSLFGFFWTLLEPLGLMLIYTLVFSVIIKKMAGGVEPYPLYVLLGLIPWTFFNNSLKKGTKSLSGNASLIKKVYFPREIFPISMILANLVNFIPAFALVIVFGLALGKPIQWEQLALLPLMILLLALFALACSFLISVLNVYYRDVEFITNLMMRGWMYLSPIIYPISLVTQSESETVRQFADLYFLNPMAVILSLFHGIFFPDQAEVISFGYILYVIIFTLVLLVVSWIIFKRLNRRVGEVI